MNELLDFISLGVKVEVRPAEFFEYLELLTGTPCNVLQGDDAIYVTQDVFDRLGEVETKGH